MNKLSGFLNRKILSVGKVWDVCRNYNVTEQTFYGWLKIYGSMEVYNARKARGAQELLVTTRNRIGMFIGDVNLQSDIAR